MATCPYLIRFFHLTFSPPHVFFAILLHTLLTFSVFFNFLLRLSISSAFIFFSPASILHGHCSLSISSVFFFSSSPASRQSRHLNQKTKKKKVKKRYRESERESWAEERRRRKKKEEEEEERRRRRRKKKKKKKKKSLRWTGLDCWRRLEVTETVGKGLKSNPAETGLPAETGRNRPRFWPRWNIGVTRTG
jgi:hypothetical protein